MIDVTCKNMILSHFFIETARIAHMARIGINYDDVKHAAIHLLSQGIAPSVQKIREKLGTGSNTTIAEHLNLWREEYATKEIHHLPANMPKELISAIDVLWQAAMEQAANQLAVTKKALSEQQEKLQQEKPLMEQKFVELQTQLAQCQQQIKIKEIQCQALQTESAVLKERLSQQLVDSNTLKNQHETRLKQAYDEKHIAHEQEKKTQTEMRQLQQQLQTQAEKYQTEITRERQRQEESENRWLTQIDQARTELQRVRKENENIINKQNEKIGLLQKTITDLQNKNIASNTTCIHLEKNNKELGQQLTQYQSQYHNVLNQLSALKAKESMEKRGVKKQK